MIVTLSPSPSLDRTYTLDTFVSGTVNRATRSEVEASGKGVNVSRAVAGAGGRTVAVLPLGGAEGRQLADLLGAEGIVTAVIPVVPPTRTNVTIALSGDSTKVNAPSPPLTGSDQQALLDTLGQLAGEHPGCWICVAGATPPGAEDLPARVVALARASGARSAVDTSGAALVMAADAGPDLIAPNHLELAELLSVDTTGWSADGSGGDVAQAAALATELGRRTGGSVVATLGAAGAVLHLTEPDGERAWHAVAPPVVPVNTVGAGDALLAGFLDHLQNVPDLPVAALVNAVAWGTAACLLPGTSGPIAATARPELVQVRELTG